MLRTHLLLPALTALALASIANAATLTVTPDQTSYQVGDTITLIVTGDHQGASTARIFGQLLFSNPSVADFASGTPGQTQILPPFPIPPAPLTCTASSCDMFNQSFVLGPTQPAPVLMIAQVSFVAMAPGVSNANWNTDPSNGFELEFFGLTNAPGTVITVIPEPGTAALLGLGLLGVALARRR